MLDAQRITLSRRSWGPVHSNRQAAGVDGRSFVASQMIDSSFSRGFCAYARPRCCVCRATPSSTSQSYPEQSQSHPCPLAPNLLSFETPARTTTRAFEFYGISLPVSGSLNTFCTAARLRAVSPPRHLRPGGGSLFRLAVANRVAAARVPVVQNSPALGAVGL